MSPESLDSFRQLLASQEAMARDITEVKVAVGKMEAKLTTLCQQRKEQHEEHVSCQASTCKRLDQHEQEQQRIWESVNRLTAWGKAIAMVGSIVVAVLTILNILLSLGVKL